MESDLPERDAALPPGAASAAPGRAEWRALSRLRERVEAAATEIERLRAENAALAARVAAGSDDGVPLPTGEPPEVLRTRIEAFLASLDRVLASAPDDAAPDDTATP